MKLIGCRSGLTLRGARMIEYLQCSRIFEKQLKTLRRSGKKGEWAASQCETILQNIRAKGLLTNEVFCKRTKNGEYRISNCVKYDLGNGFRLVTIRSGSHLFIPFVGSHDETDQWLDSHKQYEFKPGDPAYRREPVLGVEKSDQADQEQEKQLSKELTDPYEEQLLERVDDAMLRQVFKGLYGQ